MVPWHLSALFMAKEIVVFADTPDEHAGFAAAAVERTRGDHRVSSLKKKEINLLCKCSPKAHAHNTDACTHVHTDLHHISGRELARVRRTNSDLDHQLRQCTSALDGAEKQVWHAEA